MPELGERAGSVGPLIASIGGAPLVAGERVAGLEAPTEGGPGCRLPIVEVDDVIDSGGAIPMFQTTDLVGDAPDSPGIARILHAVRATSGKEAARILKDKRFRMSGKLTKKLLTGDVHLVRVELEDELEPGDSVVVATDVKGDPTRRAPSGVDGPDNPLANVRDLYHVGLSPSDGSVFVGSTDLASGEFYTGKRPFAAWLDGTDAYLLIPRNGLGEDFRAVAFRSGAGADVAGLGASPRTPTDGEAGWIEQCIAYALIHEPLELVGGGVYPSRGEVEFCFDASEDDLDLLGDWLDGWGDGVATGEVELSLFEDGRVVEGSLPVKVDIEDGNIYIAFQIGFSAYGFHALTGIDAYSFDLTGDPALDDLFSEAAETIVRALSPVVFAERAGVLQGLERCRPAAVR
jgi:hypothetical protein